MRANTGARRKGESPNEYTALVYAISKGMSKKLRTVNNLPRREDGFTHLEDLLNAETLSDLRATQDDIRKIVRGERGNWKKIFELLGDGRSGQSGCAIATRT